MIRKEGVEKYVRIMKKLFVLLSCVAIPAFMVCLVFAFAKYMAFWIIAPAVGICYLVIYGFYAMRVSMGAVIGVEVTDKVIHIHTKRKTFTYDALRGCVGMKTKGNKYIGTFRTQDSQDKFIFYRRVLFSRYSEEQFTPEEIRRIYPPFEEE